MIKRFSFDKVKKNDLGGSVSLMGEMRDEYRVVVGN